MMEFTASTSVHNQPPRFSFTDATLLYPSRPCLGPCEIRLVGKEGYWGAETSLEPLDAFHTCPQYPISGRVARARACAYGPSTQRLIRIHKEERSRCCQVSFGPHISNGYGRLTLLLIILQRVHLVNSRSVICGISPEGNIE